jgi:cytochrome c556
MRLSIVSALSAIAVIFAVAAVNTGPAFSMDHGKVIKERKATMKAINKANKVIKKFKKGDASQADAAKAAATLQAESKKITGQYPKGSGRPAVDAKKTRAEAKIWEDWAGFEKAAAKFGGAADKLAAAVAANDMDAVKKVKLGCGGCHKPFRGKKVK